LANPELRELLDIKVYIDADHDLRFIRRMERDICDRGRTRESVVKQYLEFVRPMHLEYVEPSKHFADVVIFNEGDHAPAIELLVDIIGKAIREAESSE
jgi:uridine kinase